MIMIPGSGTISNYGSYSSNCIKGQWPFKVPVNSLSNVQLYINLGTSAPGAATYELIHTCGASGGTVESIMPGSYVIGQDENQNYYGVFKDFSGASPTCFVIAITIDGQIYFSEEYCINPCDSLTLIEACYGNLDPLLSHDCEGIYFGESQGGTLGDATVKYRHKAYVRDAEVSLLSIKNNFKLGRTRNFRTEKEKIFQFMIGELVPEWYLYELDAIFNRGEVYIGGVRYLVNDTPYEKSESCKLAWHPIVHLKESCYQSFSCETDPCSVAEAECCDPTGITVTVETESEPGCCDPEIVTVYSEETGGS